jgi:DNA-binding MarR family transcriptional regulator
MCYYNTDMKELPPPPPARFIDDYLLYLLARASHLISSEMHGHLRRRGISPPVWRVLGSLLGSTGETVTGLAEVCLLQQPTMTKLLDRMVRDGLVRRTQDQRDRRVVRVALTERGEVLGQELAALAKRAKARAASAGGGAGHQGPAAGHPRTPWQSTARCLGLDPRAADAHHLTPSTANRFLPCRRCMSCSASCLPCLPWPPWSR